MRQPRYHAAGGAVFEAALQDGWSSWGYLRKARFWLAATPQKSISRQHVTRALGDGCDEEKRDSAAMLRLAGWRGKNLATAYVDL